MGHIQDDVTRDKLISVTAMRKLLASSKLRAKDDLWPNPSRNIDVVRDGKFVGCLDLGTEEVVWHKTPITTDDLLVAAEVPAGSDGGEA